MRRAEQLHEEILAQMDLSKEEIGRASCRERV